MRCLNDKKRGRGEERNAFSIASGVLLLMNSESKANDLDFRHQITSGMPKGDGVKGKSPRRRELQQAGAS